MENKFIRVDEVADELGVSRPYAYKLIRQLNEELKGKGFITIAVLDQVESAKFGVASAFSTILILIVYVAIFITNQVLSRMGADSKKIELS